MGETIFQKMYDEYSQLECRSIDLSVLCMLENLSLKHFLRESPVCIRLIGKRTTSLRPRAARFFQNLRTNDFIQGNCVTSILGIA